MKRFLSLLSQSCVIPENEPQWIDSVPPSLKRREPRILQLAYICAARIIQNIPPMHFPKSVIVATALGALDETRNFLFGVFDEGFGSPRNFITSVHNSIAGKVALEFKIHGPNLTICDGQNSLASAISTIDLLNSDEFPALLICIDEHIDLLDIISTAFKESGANINETKYRDGAIGFLLGVPGRCQKCIRAYGPVPFYSNEPKSTCDDLLKYLTGSNPQSLVYCNSGINALEPAVAIYIHALSMKTGPLIVGTHSVASKSAALVEFRS